MIYGGKLGEKSQTMIDYFQVCACALIHLLHNLFNCARFSRDIKCFVQL